MLLSIQRLSLAALTANGRITKDTKNTKDTKREHHFFVFLSIGVQASSTGRIPPGRSDSSTNNQRALWPFLVSF